MKRAAIALCALALAGCSIRTDAEDRAIARAAATAYEAARAVELGRAPAEPLAVVKDCASAIAGVVGHPYPAPPALPPEKKP